MISASLVLYNTSDEWVQRVVDSVAADSVDLLYLIDHSLVPRRPRINYPEDLEIRYLVHPNVGFGCGHNVAIERCMDAGARYHAVLNPDIYWSDPVIRSLSEYMDSHNNVGMMTPKVLYPDGSLQYNCKMIPTPWDLIGRRFLPGFMTRKRNKRFELRQTGYDKIMNVPYMHGCFFLLRTDALRREGLFDERFFMYPEDIDLTRRIHRHWETLFYPDVKIYHAHAAESRKFGKMLKVHVINMIRYFNKWGWWRDPERRDVNQRLLKEFPAP